MSDGGAATNGRGRDRGRHVGVVGMAVMGENLSMNIARHGFPVAVYNRTAARTDEFIAERGGAAGIVGLHDIADFVESLERPRRIIMMVKAGPPVDAVIGELLPHLEPGDILVDGGNSFFLDTARREQALAAAGFNFVGMGVSGGEEGALWGPSLMPGGPKEAYDRLEPMLAAIAAKTEAGPCVTYIGPGGSGHYVKMVHNGIEYADMQLIAETYDIMRHALGLSAPAMSDVFRRWNQGRLASYLIEITAAVLAQRDTDTNNPLVDMILDAAEQKGTGRWTSVSAMDLGSPAPTIDAAVTARVMSSLRDLRLQASQILTGPKATGLPDGLTQDRLLAAQENALYFSKISAYAQGMALMRAAGETYDWHLNLAEIARIWKGGCIIRAALLDQIRAAFSGPEQPANLLLAPNVAPETNAAAAGARTATEAARTLGLPCPAMSASLDYFDSLRAQRLPANLIQAQRDYFGAHTYRRLDRDGVFHTHWAPFS
ncbi:MAG TPA: NADP-dependent phosphogluconate dehydrogenase [Thermomicrobiales bacterium]|nr:NADP-dependent phosphogluconate dehydrogenase [Thermomicrobiales bacterium]